MNRTFGERFHRDMRMNLYKYLMILPVIIFLFLFSYKPMYGIVIAFKDYRPTLTIASSKWVGFKYFIQFFNDPYFLRLIRNTISISLLSIIFGFPAPIILALMINEVKNTKFKRVVQTISYMPHFISIVVVCGLITIYSGTDGVINDIIAFFGGVRSNLLSNKNAFYPILISSDIWQGIGWGAIIYLAAIAGVDQEQYEAAEMDGAGRFKKIWYITIPGIMNTIIILFILRMGAIISVGADKILLLYQPLTYETADVISTYVYRKGLVEANYSLATAIGLFNTVINLIFLVFTNKICKKINGYGLF